MTNFYGYEIELFATKLVAEGHGVSVQSGVDCSGGTWLIVLGDRDPEHLVWICAPVSPRALSELAQGKATVRDVLRHTVTGTVEVVTVEGGRAVPDSCMLCCNIPGALLPPGDLRVSDGGSSTESITILQPCSNAR
jgi:hypothetical protein